MLAPRISLVACHRNPRKVPGKSWKPRPPEFFRCCRKLRYDVRVLTQLRRATPSLLILACALFLLASLFVVRLPDVPGASLGSYVSTFLIALPSAIALFRYLGPRRATLSLLALFVFAYAIESFGVATGLPY